jgi:predicted anti-sigma-YlaC factor YlaD
VNTDFVDHIPDAIFDELAMEMLSEDDCAFWEEHLLVCDICRDRLAEADEYIRVVRDAAAAISHPPPGQSLPPVTEFRKRRALAKPMMAATHAALLLAFLVSWHIMFQLQ